MISKAPTPIFEKILPLPLLFFFLITTGMIKVLLKHAIHDYFEFKKKKKKKKSRVSPNSISSQFKEGINFAFPLPPPEVKNSLLNYLLIPTKLKFQVNRSIRSSRL